MSSLVQVGSPPKSYESYESYEWLLPSMNPMVPMVGLFLPSRSTPTHHFSVISPSFQFKHVKDFVIDIFRKYLKSDGGGRVPKYLYIKDPSKLKKNLQ